MSSYKKIIAIFVKKKQQHGINSTITINGPSILYTLFVGSYVKFGENLKISRKLFLIHFDKITETWHREPSIVIGIKMSKSQKWRHKNIIKNTLITL